MKEAIEVSKFRYYLSRTLRYGIGFVAASSLVVPRLSIDDSDELYNTPPNCNADAVLAQLDFPDKPSTADQVDRGPVGVEPTDEEFNTVYEFEIVPTNIIDTAGEIFSNYYKVGSSYDRNIALNLNLWSDGPIDVDYDYIFSLFKLTYQKASQYDALPLALQAACLAQTIEQNRVFAGQFQDTTLNLLIPSDNRVCFKNQALQNEDIEGCDARGFSVPAATLFGPIGSQDFIILTNDANQPPEDQAELFIHEIWHFLIAVSTGLKPNMEAYERQARYAASQTIKAAQESGFEFKPLVKYP